MSDDLDTRIKEAKQRLAELEDAADAARHAAQVRRLWIWTSTPIP